RSRGKTNSRRSILLANVFFFSSRRRHTSSKRDWSSDVCSSDLDRFWNRESVRVSYAGHTGGDRSGLQLFVGGPCPHPPAGRQKRSEERRVGKECIARGEAAQEQQDVTASIAMGAGVERSKCSGQ